MALIDFRRDKRISDDNRNVLREFCQELGGDPVVLAKSLGLKVYRVDLPWEQDGYTEADAECGAPSGYKIILNARLPLERQKFTLAHEIGHFVLHRNTPQFKEIERQQDNVIAFPSAFRSVSDAWDNRDRPQWMEYEADQFAVHLLLPANAVRRSAEFIEGRPMALAKRLSLSRTFVLHRFEELAFD
jgi:Zn-dependent peptidase ImmA (M78 family)